MTSGPQPNLYAALNIRSAKTSRNISFARLHRRKLSPLSSAWRAEPDAAMVSRHKHLNQPAAPSRFRTATPVASSRVCETQFRIVGISCELAVLANVTRRPTLAWPCLPDRTSVELDGDVAVSVCSDHPSGRDVVVRAENVCFVVGASHEQVIDCDVVDPRGPEANIFTGPMAKSAGQIAVHAIGVRDVLLRPHPPRVAQSDVIETGAPGQRRETVAGTVTVDQRLLGGHDDDPWGFRGSTRR